MPSSTKKLIPIGKVTGVFGVKGWVKIFSYTHPRDNILQYLPWQLISHNKQQEVKLTDHKSFGDKIIAEINHCQDRDLAKSFVGSEIAIYRDQLPAPAENEFYWTDLEQMEVINKENISLGKVDHLMETGANDVMLVIGKKRHLIPFLMDQVILKIDFDARIIYVDWDDNF